VSLLFTASLGASHLAHLVCGEEPTQSKSIVTKSFHLPPVSGIKRYGLFYLTLMAVCAFTTQKDGTVQVASGAQTSN